MFLDDKLYQEVKSFEIKKPEDFQTLVDKLYKICEEHYKPQFRDDPTLTYAEGRIIMDRVFKNWDLFIERLEKDNWWLVDVLVKYSYKDLYMKVPELKELYEKGE